MLPKSIRSIFYWILRSGPIGRVITNIISYIFYFSVKIFKIPPRQDIAGLTIISHKYKFIFFGIPKVASRSFFNYFIKKNKKEFQIEWYEKRDMFFTLKEKYPAYYTFSFVRNPWSRAVSCYKSKIENAVVGKRARIHSFYKSLSPNMTFDDFINWLETKEGQDQFADRHWISQHLFLEDKNGNILCDFIGKYENIDHDWKIICDKIKIPYEPLEQKGWISAINDVRNPEKNDQEPQTIQKNNHEKFFNDERRTVISRRYKKDIERFEYEFSNE